MTDRSSGPIGRRRALRLIAVSGLASSLAGCTESGDGSGDGGATPTDSTATTTPTEEGAPPTPTEEEMATPTEAEATPTEGGMSGDQDVTATVSLQIRGSRSNVEKFSTLRTTFQALELSATDGTTVRLDDSTQDVDLTELGPGGSVDLFETTVPAGSYDEANLYLPIQEAALSDGSDPEFDRTVPVSREARGDPVEISGERVRINATVALLRIAGDGPWTYTLGWGVR